MIRFRRMKSLAVLLSICMFLGMINTNAYAKSDDAVSDYNDDESAIQTLGMGTAEAVSGSAIYVGGPNAVISGSDGSTTTPFYTLRDAATTINRKGAGSYKIIMLGSTKEEYQVVFGNGGDFDISIKAEPVSGGAITVSKEFDSNSLISVVSNTSLTVVGNSNDEQLVFDGGGADYQGNFPLINVMVNATLNLNANSSIQNNINTNTSIYYQGGGIANSGMLNINGGNIVGNRSSGNGGGIFNKGVVTINGGSISLNHSVSNGGGIYNNLFSSLTLNSGTISNNTCDSSGSAIYNSGDTIIKGGIITQHSDTCLTNVGTVTMNNGNITDNDGHTTISNLNNGTFNMKGGTISHNKNTASPSDFNAIHLDGGVFNMTMGSIENNSGGYIASVISGSFNMANGYIRNNTVSTVFYISESGSFSMSGGEIKNNSGNVLETNAPFFLSNFAYIRGLGDEAGRILMNIDNNAYISISDSLMNIPSLDIVLNNYSEGFRILSSSDLTPGILSKFLLEDTNYYIDNTGRLERKDKPLVFYVNVKGSDYECVTGSSNDPLLTIEEALYRIGTNTGTIIIQSDMDVVKPIPIYSDITIKSDNASRVIYQKIPFSLDGNYMFIVDKGTLTLGDKEQTSGGLIIDNVKYDIGALVHNSGTVNLYNNAVIRNGKFPRAIIDNVEAVANIDGGSIIDSRNTIIDNLYKGTVNLVSGTISAIAGDKTYGIGIWNSNTSTVNMSGGTITGFTDNSSSGIYNEGELNISGGTISNNKQSIKSKAAFNMSQNPSIPIGINNSNGIYLSNKDPILLNSDFILSDDNQILIVYDKFNVGDQVLTGDEDTIMTNRDNFVLSDTDYGISETGTVKYIGKPYDYYVNRDYEGGDSDGSKERPYLTLDDAVDAIDKSLKVGKIYIGSNLLLVKTINIESDISILNYGPTSHTISSKSPNKIFSINGTGSLTLGDKDGGNDDAPTLVINGAGRESSECMISNDGILRLYSGVKLHGNDNIYTWGTGAIINRGILNMYGGLIEGNKGRDCGGVNNLGDFIMEGGKIINCIGDDVDAVINQTNATFTMSGGTIENNGSIDGVAIHNEGKLHLSGGASIPMSSSEGNKLRLDKTSSIYIDSNLSTSKYILLTTSTYIPGRQLLKGDEVILNTNYQKFILDSTATNYRLGEDGVLVYTGETKEYYVDSDHGSDGYNGSRESPFATLSKAVLYIDEGVGTIHICSDIDITATIEINGVIKLVNEGDPHVILRNPTYKGYLFIVKGQLELGDSKLNGQSEERLLTINGNRDNVQANSSLINNEDGSIILNNSVVIEDNHTTSGGGGIYNNGSLLMKGGVIQNNKSDFSGGGIYSYYGNSITILGVSIRYNVGAYSGGGIYNNNGSLSLYEGSIHDNKATYGGGIYHDDGILNISGGRINNNKAKYGAGLYLYESNNNSMSGGQIFGNTGLDEEEEVIGKGVNVENGSFTILGDVSIASDNEIALFDYDGSMTWKSFINVKDSLYDDIPVITLAKYYYDSGEMKYYYPVGDKIIRPATGYSLTKQDISKFQMFDSDYGINTQGIIRNRLNETWFSIVNKDDIAYTGNEIRPLVGKKGSTVLVEDRDYRVSYKDNIYPGTAKVYIHGMGNYGGTVIKTFTIKGYTPQAPYTPSLTPTPAPTPTDPVRDMDIEVLVTIERNRKNNSLNTSIRITPNSLQAIVSASRTSRLSVIISIESDELREAMQDDSITSVNINVTLLDALTQNNAIAGSRILLDPDIINAARDNETDINLSVNDEDGREIYSWSFSGSGLAASDKDIDELDLSLTIQRGEDNEDLAELLGNSQTGTSNQNSLVINFGHHGDLPTQASVRMYVGNMGYSEGDKLYLYYYNSETGKLDTLPYSSNYVVDKDGYITVNVIHCSEYVFLPKQARATTITSLRNQITVESNKITLNLGSKKKSGATIQVNLPKTLEQVKDLKEKTSASAVGAVKITYKSGNSKVASVDSTGKITAKKSGIVDITVTVTLYSGKIKTFNISITVNKL